MIETIQQAVKPHDKYQIEMKLDYALSGEKETRYRISTYFFIPQALDVSEETYSKKAFYQDVKNYIRLKTPILNLRDLLEYEQSPLCRIESLIKQSDWAHSDEIKQHLITNFKLFKCDIKECDSRPFDFD